MEGFGVGMLLDGLLILTVAALTRVWLSTQVHHPKAALL